ncbi:peptidoglycan-binding protein [Streptomyces sp. NBC_00102]|uniref:peptidoglycan-binding protein n=1 Tax=Streptomyces sp. NBC_00102 TaxID=2975652 RepID=UPI002259D383|nr:peptidoglycan-binding protein [Streptomyces sp. NBC_00102]MCX5398473.1 peptidoglycan-binding protein [Streptomyces sp. NBC_00102]
MATPMTADQFVKALEAEGLTISEHAGWRTHNRNGVGAWGPVNGVVIHHTAGSNSLELVYAGRSDLPGPLCHSHLAKNGTVTMVGNGRANHAGSFAANAFNAMVTESSTHPRPDSAEPVDANSRTYGLEIENLGNGTDPYPAAQYDAAVRWAAAVCRFHGWSADSVIGHAEGTRRKVDPSFSMSTFRADVAKRLKPPTTPGTATKTTSTSTGKPKPVQYAPFPGAAYFKKNPRSALITAMGRRLVAEGCGKYKSGPGPQWTEVDRLSYAAWQRKRGFSGTSADGWPGAQTWAALRVPKA